MTVTKNNGFTTDSLLRPENWEDYVGQDKIKANLKVILEAAKKREETSDHLLFYGQAGLGKTTLAHLVAKELKANLKLTSGPALERLADLAAILSNLEKNDVLFIDEAHRLNRAIEEVLYPAMESRKLHLIIGKGPGARAVTLDLPPFTLIAATTRANLLSGPLRSRFGASFKLDFYELADMEQIIKRSAWILKMPVDSAAVALLARAARFTPRVANRLLKRVRDYVTVHNLAVIDEKAVEKTLALLQIDHLGLEPTDRRLLQVIIEKFKGGPVGINSLAAALNDDPGNIESICEPYLMSISFLIRTSSGRMATPEAYKYLGYQTSPEGLV